MPTPRYSVGESWRPLASALNAYGAAADHHAQTGGVIPPPTSPAAQWSGDVRQIYNGSGEDCDAGDVLALDGVIVTPEDIAIDENFLRWGPQLVFNGVKPDLQDPVGNIQHIGKFAVLLEPIPAGHPGKAVFSGIVTCPIAKDHDDHVFADLAHDTFRLTTNFYGAAEILYKSEWPAASDNWYAVVKLGLFQSPLIYGVTQEEIAADASGDVQVLWNNNASQTITAWNEHMHGGNAVGSGKDVMMSFHRDRGRIQIEEMEC